MPTAKRRSSWKTSSQHRSHRTSGADAGIGSIAANQYSKQLNPYKQGKLSSSLRGSRGHEKGGGAHSGVTRSPSASDDDMGIGDLDLDLGDDEDDDELGLDKILSSIAGIGDGKGPDVTKVPSYNPVSKKADLGHANGDATKSDTEAGAPSSAIENDATEDRGELLKELLDLSPNDKPQISEVDFGRDVAHRRKTPPIQNTNSMSNEDDDISPASEEEDTLWSDGDATRQHRLMMEAEQAPAFASGFEDNNRLESIGMTGPSFRTAKDSGSGSSLLDSLIDDVESKADRNPLLENEPKNVHPANNTAATPLRGRRLPQSRYTQSRMQKQPGPPPREAHPSSRDDSARKVLEIQRKEDETLSTVTDPSESPFIYTYKKAGDDDSVSQITSSLAGSLGSAQLQNIPTNFGAQRSRNRTGLSWMNTAPGGGMGGSRMTQRKGGMVIAGPYGRDRGRKSNRTRGGGSGSNSRDGSGSGSYDGSNNLDEIDFALNADCKPPPGRGQRRPATRRPPRTNSRDMMGDDLSTVESSTYNQPSHESSLDLASNVSRLGMGGISTGAVSVSEASIMSDASTSTMGFVQSLSMFAWKAQHRAGRFFFPTSPDVMRRKKYDRSDSMSDLEDILAEEGASALPHRKRQGARNDDEEEEIDYFGRAMSASGLHGSPRKSQRKKYFWNGSSARMGGLCFLLTATITWYRMPQKGGDDPLTRPDHGEFRAGKQRLYDPSVGGNGQVLDPATDAMVDSRAFANDQGRNSGRLGQPIENRFGEEPIEDNLAAQQEQQHFLVNGNVHLPQVFENLANVDDLLFQRGIDMPFYWHVPRSGGGTMNDVLGGCLHLTLAADAGGSEGHGQEEALKVLHFSRQVSYVNVDTSTHQGIARAKSLDLVSSGLADVVISPLLYEASTLFTPTRRGRMFTILRHPVERAASLFYFIQETQWKQPGTRNDQFADISIEEFYKKGFAENNWMTRFLTNELTKGELTESDLTIAKEVLRQKCLVGLLEEKGETMERIEKYFGWRPKNEEEQDCLEKKLEWAWPMKHKHPTIESDSRAWRLIEASNKLDLRLYEYATELFAQQGEQLFSH